jgi:hypothetical protein
VEVVYKDIMFLVKTDKKNRPEGMGLVFFVFMLGGNETMKFDENAFTVK